MVKVIILFLLIFLTSCEKSGIMTYRVPKQTISVAQLANKLANKDLAWIISDTWLKQDQTEFRIASYVVPNGVDSTGSGDFSIVKFPGKAGGLLANVNRWRDQLDLDSLTITSLADHLVTIDHSFLSITFLELHRLSFLVNTHPFESMYVGFFMYDNDSYFFKLTGSKALLNDQYDFFVAILKSIYYENR
tara:strand:+ start:147 stop:716 length:570 start_codon:yes stop_codon:yes gene_type:complete